MSIRYDKFPPYKLTLNDDGTFQVKAGESLSQYNWAINGNFGNESTWDLFRRPGGSPDGTPIINKDLIRTGETLLYLPDYKKRPGVAPSPTPAPAPAPGPAPIPGQIDRPLTSGEIALLRSVFGNGITYSAVRIHDYKWFPLQPAGCTMTPNGEMYWNQADYEADFSTASVNKKAWFVHEGGHLYEHYGLGWNVIARGIWDRQYTYTLIPSKTKLSDYGLEQIGDIARDYYYLTLGYSNVHPPNVLADYTPVLLPIP